ncbi:flotillin family protein [filamentous cyanobacterium LEGE 11480]|uniref:Flotillin family protein n=1 Tax=Romeriopsis navalis LEGE 11480 TaxID=2777977 RepID=A0A928VP19_9CYAN|nr:flotillin family protein [Romeriopsis navalis]MBE9032061.1 flotillin family protein [Romeriopsis navalis LEGE 11480]
MTRLKQALIWSSIGLAQVAASIAISSATIAAPTKAITTDSTPTSSSNPVLIATANPTIPTVATAQSTNLMLWNNLPTWLLLPLVTGGGIVGLVFATGLVVISEREVGVVVKKFSFSGKGLPADRLIAMDGEAGYQADTLAPGWHWGYWPWQYSVKKERVINVPQGQIALVIANDGCAIPPERILGKVITSNDYQDARKFLKNGGEKGRQLGFLTSGTYRINTALFKVITADTAQKHGMQAAQLMLTRIKSDMVGMITTLDGRPIDQGEIAGSTIPGHDNFQNGQKFMQQGGRRGLQEQILLSGSWNLNPWFVQVEQVPMTEVPIGYVGVVISYVGQAHEDISGDAFTHGDLVHQGHKGVWTEPLYPGKHPINTRVMSVELVPTTNIVLNWSGRMERHHYDEKLSPLTVLSHDGFTFDLEVSQIIHVGALDAPKVISRVGSMQNLVDHVLEPTIGNYFRNSAQDCTVLDFLDARSERQSEAADFIKVALRSYDVQAIDTLIGDIHPPDDLMETQTERKIAEEQRKTYEVQQLAQSQRQQLVRETALAEIQEDLVRSEENVKMAELKASSKVKEAAGAAESIRLKAAGEAEALRAIGQANADAYQAGVESLGNQNYTAMQLMQIIGERNVRVIPEIMVGQNGNGGGLSDALLSMLLWNQTHEGQPLPMGQAVKPAATPHPATPTTRENVTATPEKAQRNGQRIEPLAPPIAPPLAPPNMPQFDQ